MKDALQLNIGGIKCDNQDCDYRNESVTLEDYENWLNKPCPKCGQNLLTEADYYNVKFLLGIAELANKIYPKIEDDEEIIQGSIIMDGSGKMDFNRKEKNDNEYW